MPHTKRLDRKKKLYYNLLNQTFIKKYKFMRGQDLPTLFILKKIKNKTANSKNSRVNTTKLKTLNWIYIHIYTYIYIHIYIYIYIGKKKREVNPSSFGHDMWSDFTKLQKNSKG